MKRYTVSAMVTVSAYTYVEAKTPEEALEIAEGRMVEIGGMNSGCDPCEVFVIEDADGEPCNLEVL